MSEKTVIYGIATRIDLLNYIVGNKAAHSDSHHALGAVGKTAVRRVCLLFV